MLGLPFFPVVWTIQGTYGPTPGGLPGELAGFSGYVECCRTPAFGTIRGTGTFQPIPEPSTLALVGTGLVLSWRHRRRLLAKKK